MKLRTSSRITALVLALMMIVPLLSIPTFADETATTETHYTFGTDFTTTTSTAWTLYNATLTAEGTEYGKNDATDTVLVVDSTTTDNTRSYLETKQNAVSTSSQWRKWFCGALSGNQYIITQADYYFPAGTTGIVNGGFMNCVYTTKTVDEESGEITAVNQENSLARIEFYELYANGSVITLTPATSTSTPDEYTTTDAYKTIPVDTWFTLTAVINTETGLVEQYVNGVKYYEFQFTGGTGSSAKEYTGLSFRSFTFSMPRSKNAGNTTCTRSGAYAVDNAVVYTDIKQLPTGAPNVGGGDETTTPDGGDETTTPDGGDETTTPDGGDETTTPDPDPVEPEEPADDRFFTIDYEDKTEGDAATNAQGTSPSSAIYTKFDGDMAIRFDMVATTGTTVGYEFFTSTHGKVYDASKLTDNPEFNWHTATLADLTLIGPSDGATTAWIYAARHGDLVQVYTFGSADASTEEAGKAITDISSLGRRGDFPVFAADTDAGAIEAIHGGTNSFVPFKIPTKAFEYDETEGAINTFVLNASYYISADLKGQVQSLLGGLDEVYLFNFNTMKFKSNGVEADLVTNAWNKVTVILTLTNGNASVDVYLNGSYVATKSKANTTTSGAAWTAMRILRNYSNVPNAGTFYLDDVSVEKYVDYQAYDPASGYGVIVDGSYYTTEQQATKLYGDNVYAINASIVKTEQTSSIRLSADVADTATSGIRFATLLDTDQVAILESYTDLIASVNYGTLIVPVDYYSKETAASELTFASLAAAEKKYLKVAATPGMFYESETTPIDNDGTTDHFVGSIINILSSNIAREFTGRGYLEITLVTGETVMVYSDTWNSVSIKEQANAVLSNYAGTIYYEMLSAWANA